MLQNLRFSPLKTTAVNQPDALPRLTAAQGRAREESRWQVPVRQATRWFLCPEPAASRGGVPVGASRAEQQGACPGHPRETTRLEALEPTSCSHPAMTSRVTGKLPREAAPERRCQERRSGSSQHTPHVSPWEPTDPTDSWEQGPLQWGGSFRTTNPADYEGHSPKDTGEEAPMQLGTRGRRSPTVSTEGATAEAPSSGILGPLQAATSCQPASGPRTQGR